MAENIIVTVTELDVLLICLTVSEMDLVALFTGVAGPSNSHTGTVLIGVHVDAGGAVNTPSPFVAVCVQLYSYRDPKPAATGSAHRSITPYVEDGSPALIETLPLSSNLYPA